MPPSKLGLAGIRSFSNNTIHDLSRKYPFPLSANPLPHEIFHLPSGADQAAIKRRYFQLVKIHHPDTARALGIPTQVAETRFQLISTAYERLQNPASAFSPRDQKYYEEIQRRRAYAGFSVRDIEMRRKATQAEARAGSLWQRDEGLFFIVAILVSYFTPSGEFYFAWILTYTTKAMFATVYSIITPTPSQLARKQHDKSQRYLADARTRGKEDGMRRREEIRSWLRDRQAASPMQTDDASPSSSSLEQASSSQSDIAGFGNAVSIRKSRSFPGYERERERE